MKSVSYEQFRDVTVEFSQVSEIAIVKMSILPEFFKFSKFKMRTISKRASVKVDDFKPKD